MFGNYPIYQNSCPAAIVDANLQLAFKSTSFNINITTEDGVIRLKYTKGDYIYLQGSLVGNNFNYIDTDNSNYSTGRGTVNFTNNGLSCAVTNKVSLPSASVCNASATPMFYHHS